MAKKNAYINYPSSEKIYIPGEINKIKVGMRQIKLTDTDMIDTEGDVIRKKNNPVVVYDTSGPYSDPQTTIDFKKGITRIREEWGNRRKDIQLQSADKDISSSFSRIYTPYRAKEGKTITQMYYAKKRIITPEMEYVAIRENQQVEALGLKSFITPDFVRKELAAGRAVIPANINHPEAEPMIIGKKFLVKVNTNMPGLASSLQPESEIENMISICKWGSDTIMDLSGKGDIADAQNALLRNCPIPVGSVPIYEAFQNADGDIEKLSWEVFRETLIRQAERGIDFFIIHAALLRSYLDMTLPRLSGIVAGGGYIIAEWMRHHKEENFLYTHFSEICDILKVYDITLILGDALKPGSIYDANDMAYFAELHTIGQLTKLAWQEYVQVIAEGPGHLPMNKAYENVREQQYACQHAPYFTCGLLTTDIGIGYDHVSSAIGAAHIAWQGASLVGCVPPTNQMYLPGKEDYRNAIISHKLAAHAADIAKEHPGAQVRDNALSKAGIEKRMKDLCHLAMDPEKAIQLSRKIR